MSAAESALAGPAAKPSGPELRTRLEQAELQRRKRARGVQLVLCLGIFCAGGLLAGWTDYLAPLPPPVRWGLLVLTLAVTIRRSMLARRLTRRYRISELAARAEVEMPMLEDRLVTAAEIAEGRLAAPPAARARLYRDALADLSRPAVSAAVGKRREYSAARWLIPIILVILVGTVSPEGLGRHALRFLLPFLRVDPLTATRLHYPDEYLVLRGDDARIVVEVSGVIPDRAALLLTRSAGRTEPKPMAFLGFTPEGRAKFEYVAAKPAASFTCQVAAGDAVSFPIAITIIERPRLDAATLQISPPRYTRRLAETVAPGPVRIHQGTLLTWRGRTVPDEVHWQLLYRQEDGQLVIAGEGTGPELLVAYRPQTSGKWTMILTGEHGVRDRPWAEVPVELIPDLPPVVTALQPRMDMLLPPSATVPFAIRATDDFGLAAVRLIARVNNSESQTLLAWTDTGIDPPMNELMIGGKLPLRALGVQPGDIIAWRGFAADWSELAPGGQTGMSPERYILIVPEGFVSDQPANATPEMQAALDELFALIEEQTALLRGTEASSRRTAPLPGESARLQAAQAGLRARAAALAEKFAALAGQLPNAEQMAAAIAAASTMMNQAEGPLAAGQPGSAMPPEREALRQLNRALQYVRLSRSDNSRMQRNHDLGTDPAAGGAKPGQADNGGQQPGGQQPGGQQPGGQQPGGQQPGGARSGRSGQNGLEPGGDGSGRLGQLAEAARGLANRLGRGRRGNSPQSLTDSERAALQAELDALLSELEGIQGYGHPTPNAEVERARQLLRELRPQEFNLRYAPSGAIIRHLDEVAALLTRESSVSIGSRRATGGSDPTPEETVPPEYRPLVRDYYWRLSQ